MKLCSSNKFYKLYNGNMLDIAKARIEYVIGHDEKETEPEKTGQLTIFVLF